MVEREREQLVFSESAFRKKFIIKRIYLQKAIIRNLLQNLLHVGLFVTI